MVTTDQDWKVIDLTVALQNRGIVIGFDMVREILREIDEAARARRLAALIAAST